MNNLTEKWRKLLSVSDKASYFQSPECYDFYNSLSFLKPVLVYVEVGDELKGLVCGYVIHEGKGIKKWMTRRAIIPGGVLLHPDISDSELKILLHDLKIELIKQQVIYIEFRNYLDYSNYKEILKISGFQYIAHLNFHVYTPDLATTQSKLNATKRRDLKLSLKNGAICHLTNDEKEITQLYELLSDLYKLKIKVPLFPLEFFLKLNKQDCSRFFVVKYEGHVVGGSVCVVFKEKIIYEWFVCGLDAQYKSAFPSTVATWAPIEYAANQGYKYFDMMGAGRPDSDYGVRSFKSKFGGISVEHGRFLCILRPLSYNFGKLVVEYLKKKGRNKDK
jgi:hypothetical protein